jgi:hypothetical protein
MANLTRRDQLALEAKGLERSEPNGDNSERVDSRRDSAADSDQYITLPWELLCQEMMKLKLPAKT